MKLLILTQTVDSHDSSLGYYHRWLETLASRVEHITVFALRVGAHNLPKNVTVIPLRPEKHRARLATAFRVLKYSWQYRHEYEAVLVHMNQEYLLVAGWFWMLLGKRMYMWRNHYAGNFFTDVAAFFCKKVFYTSKSSYTAKYKKAVSMPVGVDVGTCHLEEQIERPPHSILFLGRLDASKRPDLLLEALGLVAKDTTDFTATFVGGATDPQSTYPQELVERASALDLSEQIQFTGPIPNTDTYKYYRSHSIYVNCGRSGMFDKSLFKSIACGCLALFASKDMTEILGSDFAYDDTDVQDLAQHIQKAFVLSEEARALAVAEQQEKAIAPHTISVLGDRLIESISNE